MALDDFGTGYASLTHLLNFPVDIIKIDKTFIDRMSDGPGTVIVKAPFSTCRSVLVTWIVAEGVGETEDQAERIASRRLGCPYVQGYLFGRPVDRDRKQRKCCEPRLPFGKQGEAKTQAARDLDTLTSGASDNADYRDDN